MKKIFLMIMMITSIFAWEVNTHRAIDKTAIVSSETKNLHDFLNDTSLGSESFVNPKALLFDGYDQTYFKYIKDGEKNGISQWKQKFSDTPTPIDLIEAGTILEDAQWSHWIDGGDWNKYDQVDGRFKNHYTNAQNNYSGLWMGGESAIIWAWGNGSDKNQYDHMSALKYFKEGFKNPDLNQRRKFQAKMFVALGHIMQTLYNIEEV